MGYVNIRPGTHSEVHGCGNEFTSVMYRAFCITIGAYLSFINFHMYNLYTHTRVVPELEILTIFPDLTLNFVTLIGRPQCNGRYCWQASLFHLPPRFTSTVKKYGNGNGVRELYYNGHHVMGNMQKLRCLRFMILLYRLEIHKVFTT